MSDSRSPLPLFDTNSAAVKIRMAENGLNSRDAERVRLAFTNDSVWRHLAKFLQGPNAIVAF